MEKEEKRKEEKRTRKEKEEKRGDKRKKIRREEKEEKREEREEGGEMKRGEERWMVEGKTRRNLFQYLKYLQLVEHGMETFGEVDQLIVVEVEVS